MSERYVGAVLTIPPAAFELGDDLDQVSVAEREGSEVVGVVVVECANEQGAGGRCDRVHAVRGGCCRSDRRAVGGLLRRTVSRTQDETRWLFKSFYSSAIVSSRMLGMCPQACPPVPVPCVYQWRLLTSAPPDADSPTS